MNEMAVDYYRLRDEVGCLGELYLRIYDEINAMTDIVSGLDIFWDGDANAAFMESCGADIAQMGVIVKRVGETVRKCDRALEMYLQNEKEVKLMIGDIKR